MPDDAVIQTQTPPLVQGRGDEPNVSWLTDPAAMNDAVALFEQKAKLAGEPLPPKPPTPNPPPPKPAAPAPPKPAPKAPETPKPAPVAKEPEGDVEPTEDETPVVKEPEDKTAPHVPDFDKVVRPKSSDWKALNHERKQLKAELAQLKAAQTTNGDQTEAFKQLQAERDLLAQRLAETDIERSPEFQAKYGPLEAATKKAAVSAVPPDRRSAVESLLAMPEGEARDAHLEKMMEDLQPWQQMRLSQAIMESDRIRAMRNQDVEVGKATYQKRQMEGRIRLQQQQDGYMKMLEQEIAKASDPQKGLAVFRRTGDPENDSQVDQTVAVAKHILSGKVEPQELVRAVVWAAVAPRILQSLQSATTERDAALARVKELEASGPDLTTGSDVPGTGGGDGGPEPQTMAEAIQRHIHEVPGFGR